MFSKHPINYITHIHIKDDTVILYTVYIIGYYCISTTTCKHDAQYMGMVKRTMLSALRNVQFKGGDKGADWYVQLPISPLDNLLSDMGGWGENFNLVHKVVEHIEWAGLKQWYPKYNCVSSKAENVVHKSQMLEDILQEHQFSTSRW